MHSDLHVGNSKKLLQVNQLYLTFKYSQYRQWTLREAFVHFLQNPLKSLKSSNKKTLEVLKGVSFNLQEGDRVGLVGRNGAGKTSLCRCIAGLYEPTKGTVHIQGHIRAVFDTQVGINPELTGRENLELLANFMYPSSKSLHIDLMKDAADFSGLGEFLDMSYKSYSNGMKARLCLSLITAAPADILILDEVFDGADAGFREKIGIRMNDLIHRSGAVIFVSHSPEQILKTCNKVIILENGELQIFNDVKKALQIYEERILIMHQNENN